MASTTHSPFASAAPNSGIISSTNAHPGKFAPGTKVQVGSHRVIVEKYLSEGGFAHVYVVRVPTSSGRTEAAVLKRVAVPDKEALANMRTEVETMKKLKGHKRIVTYIDSHASQLKGGGYEVFLLMEYCDGGGLIDFMNTRLKVRLTEPEILHIFSDAAEGVACMHYLKPPLMHRDLKVENILISTNSSGKVYKLCDFGSSAHPIPAPTSAAEGRLIEDDIQKHTTLQYRSPEMIDVYQKRPIDEKSDIWALGVLLYKLCYYTTPFEQQGQMAIMTASFKYPPHPKFSDRLKKLIAAMLTQDPRRRPNVYEVIVEVCSMRGTAVPVKDIYMTKSTSEARNYQSLPDRGTSINSPPQIGAIKSEPDLVKQELPEVTPMRRGRPTSTSQAVTAEKKPDAASKTTNDPFAALDSPSIATRSKAVDELSSRFPSAEQFALLQDKPSNFQFQTKSADQKELNTSNTHALADDAFVPPSSTRSAEAVGTAAGAVAKAASLRQSRQPDSPLIKSMQKPNLEKPLPKKPNMVSTGTMTSTPSSPKNAKKPPNLYEDRPIWRVPPPKPSRLILESEVQSEASKTPQKLDSKLVDADSPTAELATEQESLRSPEAVSSRPSLESVRPSLLDIPLAASTRSRSADDRSSSPTKSAADHEDDFASLNRLRGRRRSSNLINDGKSSSDLDYLRALERENYRTTAQKGSPPTQKLKSAPIPVKPKPATTTKFGDALRRFESGQDTEQTLEVNDNSVGLGLTNTVKSPAEDRDLEETEELSQEDKRELERRRLSLEEKRVANAGAAYRQQLISGNKPSGVSRASTIQSRVANLLDESGRSSPVKRTAEGYGRFTGSDLTQTTSQGPSREAKTNGSRPVPAELTTPSSLATQQHTTRPSAPPKPAALRTLGTIEPTLPTQREENAVQETADTAELEFAKRYPNLSLDMVETEIKKSQQAPSGGAKQRVIRDV